MIVSPTPLPARLVYDEANFHEAARRLLSSGFFAYGSGPIGTHPNAVTMPGYTLFVAAVYSLAGRGASGVRAVFFAQALLGILTVSLVYLVGRRIGGVRVGLTGMAIAALYLPATFVETQLMTETLYTAALLVFIYAALVSVQQPSARNSFVVGVTAGLAALVRPVGVLLAGLPGLLLVVSGRRSLRRVGGSILAVAVGVALLLSPWWIRNYRLHERAIPFTTAAANPAVFAAYWPEAAPKDVQVWPTSVAADELGLARRWEREARVRNEAQWRADPEGFVLKRFRMLWVASQLPHGLLWLDGGAMSAWQIWTNRFIRAANALISLLAVAAAVSYRRRSGVWVLAGSMLYFLISYSLILPLARYAFPSVMLAAPLAGLALVGGWDRFTTRRSRAEEEPEEDESARLPIAS